jgi:hypothetical protein
MGKRFLGKTLMITSKAAQVDCLLQSWGYRLESAETLTLLWPPAIVSEDMVLIGAEKAYLYTTFELQAYGNINVRPEDIIKIADGLTKIAIRPKTKVYKKNAELMLAIHRQESSVCAELPVVHKTEHEFQVTKDMSFLFNRSGASSLNKGTIVQMTPDSEIRHYVCGYLDEIVVPLKSAVISKEQLLRDSLAHYKRNEVLNWDDFKLLNLSQIAFQYIKSCEKTGLINSAAKRLIEEGQI